MPETSRADRLFESVRTVDDRVTLLVDELRAVLEDGIADGTFDPDLDAEDTARFIVTVLTGAATERVTTGRPVECTRRMLTEYVETHLLHRQQEASA